MVSSVQYTAQRAQPLIAKILIIKKKKKKLDFLYKMEMVKICQDKSCLKSIFY